MLKIDTSDCWLEIGVGQKFTRTLVWNFSRFLRENLAGKDGIISLEAETIDREARRLANQFIFDMQEYFHATLSDAYEELENLSPEGIVELYISENLEDFQDDYVLNQLGGFRAVCDRLSTPMPIVPPPFAAAPEACHYRLRKKGSSVGLWRGRMPRFFRLLGRCEHAPSRKFFCSLPGCRGGLIAPRRIFA